MNNLIPADIIRHRESLERDVIALIDDIDGELDRIPRPYIAEDLEGLFLDLDQDMIHLLRMKEEHGGVFSRILDAKRREQGRTASLRKRHETLRSELQEIYQLLGGDRDVRHLQSRLNIWLTQFRDLHYEEHSMAGATGPHIESSTSTRRRLGR